MFGFFKRRRHKKARSRPFPPEWSEIIQRNVPYCARLSDAEQRQLRDNIKVFLTEKRFEGCAGLEITDEIRLTIAAQACILLLNRRGDYYSRMKSIFVYPREFFVERTFRKPDGVVVEVEFGRLGESWYRGPVVLAWDSVRHGAADSRDGRNVVFHEFAHQLDSESGPVDGAPQLDRQLMYLAWARVLGAEYAELIDDIEHSRRTIVSAYGATSPAEFFAVITECFFERPTQLRRKHPELYEQLRRFYHQDPADRLGDDKDGAQGQDGPETHGQDGHATKDQPKEDR